MRRPERDECDEYYFLYIDQVPEGDILEILAAQNEDRKKPIPGRAPRCLP